MSKPWTCRLGWHKWAKRSTGDGRLFLRCRRCGTENSDGKFPAAPY